MYLLQDRDGHHGILESFSASDVPASTEILVFTSLKSNLLISTRGHQSKSPYVCNNYPIDTLMLACLVVGFIFSCSCFAQLPFAMSWSSYLSRSSTGSIPACCPPLVFGRCSVGFFRCRDWNGRGCCSIYRIQHSLSRLLWIGISLNAGTNILLLYHILLVCG